MQIIIGYEKFMKEIDTAKSSGSVKLSVLYHGTDAMTVQQHVDFLTMKLKPDFIPSTFPDTEAGWLMSAGFLLQQYGECVLVTDVKPLLEQGSISIGKKTIAFTGTLAEAVKSSGTERKTSRKKKEEKSATARRVSRTRKEKSASQEVIGMNPPEIVTEAEKQEKASSEKPVEDALKEEVAEAEDKSFDLDSIKIEERKKENKANEKFVREAKSLGVDEAECEALRNALLDADNAEDIKRLLEGRVSDAKEIGEKIKKDFAKIKELAKQAEKELYL